MKNLKIDKVEVLQNGDIQVRQKEVFELKDGTFMEGSQNHRFVIRSDDQETYQQYAEELATFGVSRPLNE